MADHDLTHEAATRAAEVYELTLAHPRPEGLADVPFTMVPANCGVEQVTAAHRIIAAYHHTLAQAATPLKTITDTDLWTGITRENFEEMISYLVQSNAELLATYLSRFGSTYTWFGGITTGIDGTAPPVRDRLRTRRLDPSWT